MPTSTCRVLPVARSIRLTVPDAGAPCVVDQDVEVLALGGRLALAGESGRPSCSRSESSRPRSAWARTGDSGPGSSRSGSFLARSISTTALRLAAATYSLLPSRVIAMPPGTGLAGFAWEARLILAVFRSLSPSKRKVWTMPRFRAGEQVLAVGSPDEAAEARARAELDLRALDDPAGSGEEDASLVEDGEQVPRRVQGQVDRPAGEGDRSRLDALARGDEEAAVGLPAHPDPGPTCRPRGPGHEQEEAKSHDRQSLHLSGPRRRFRLAARLWNREQKVSTYHNDCEETECLEGKAGPRRSFSRRSLLSLVFPGSGHATEHGRSGWASSFAHRRPAGHEPSRPDR